MRARGHHSKLRPKTRGLIHNSRRGVVTTTPKITCLGYLSVCSYGLARSQGRQFSTARRCLRSFRGKGCEGTPRARPRTMSGIEEFYRRRRRRPRRRALNRTTRQRDRRPGPRHHPGSRRRTTTAATAGGRARRPRPSCSCSSYLLSSCAPCGSSCSASSCSAAVVRVVASGARGRT